MQLPSLLSSDPETSLREDVSIASFPLPYSHYTPRLSQSLTFSWDFEHSGYTALIPPNSPPPSLLGISSPAEHSRRRKIWDKALNGAAIRGYEESLVGRVRSLIEQLSVNIDRKTSRRELKTTGKCPGEIVDLAKWLSFFS